ncbi:DUF5329 domain-containing protein [Vibrio sp. SCSIO 43137]|uniref:DUF5329 domain-containing protein n=1 Tax=Vibrio sp. SCSIO 43137 TaxID=3021011 RepID=UPI0023077B41|nr:DUF5329 domain-containing protein [Vibrio sp. SCSIO 43137]WCE31982.1 DUF5329 domain-containing protein [Vibrio sp. SCSIO 43137]
MRTIVLVGMLLFSFTATAEQLTSEKVTESEIAALLQQLNHSDCQFIRSGKKYSGAEAKKHLSGKYDYARDKIKSAESFIENIASESYFTGKAYLVECSGEGLVESRIWLTEKLTSYRNKSAEQK